jgi:hypothetical protein
VSHSDIAPTPTGIRTTRRTFLAFCGAVAGAAMLPTEIRLWAMRAYATNSFTFLPHEHAVLVAAANAIAPGSDIAPFAPINTRLGPMMVPSAGNAGAVEYIELLLGGSMLYAAGTRRPPYVMLPTGVTAQQFPSTGATPLWLVKHMGWFGDNQTRPTRAYKWPPATSGNPTALPEIRINPPGRLLKLYQDGVAALDAAAGGDFTAIPFAAQTAILVTRYALEVTQFNASPLSTDPWQGSEGNEPFFLTMLDHVCEACFGDPVYGGNKNYAYWEMINFTGPSYIATGGPAPGQGWSAKDMTAPFDRTKKVTQQ